MRDIYVEEADVVMENYRRIIDKYNTLKNGDTGDNKR